jgi:hypothetical protein
MEAESEGGRWEASSMALRVGRLGLSGRTRDNKKMEERRT